MYRRQVTKQESVYNNKLGATQKSDTQSVEGRSEFDTCRGASPLPLKRQLSTQSSVEFAGGGGIRDKSPGLRTTSQAMALDKIEKVKGVISFLGSRKNTEQVFAELCKLLPTVVTCESICLICIHSLSTFDEEWNNTDL